MNHHLLPLIGAPVFICGLVCQTKAAVRYAAFGGLRHGALPSGLSGLADAHRRTVAADRAFEIARAWAVAEFVCMLAAGALLTHL